MRTFTALVISFALAVTASANDRPVSPKNDADHGTFVTNAAEAEGHVRASIAVKPIGTQERQKAVVDSTKIADQGTPESRSQEANRRIASSRSETSGLDTQAKRSAVKSATVGSTQ